MIGDGLELFISNTDIGQRFRRLFERDRCDENYFRGDGEKVGEQGFVGRREFLEFVHVGERFHATELHEDDRGAGGSQMIRERREIEVSWLGKDGVAFPTKIPAAQFGLSLNENGFDVTGMLCDSDVAAADKRDDVLRARTEPPRQKSTVAQ